VARPQDVQLDTARAAAYDDRKRPHGQKKKKGGLLQAADQTPDGFGRGSHADRRRAGAGRRTASRWPSRENVHWRGGADMNTAREISARRQGAGAHRRGRIANQQVTVPLDEPRGEVRTARDDRNQRRLLLPAKRPTGCVRVWAGETGAPVYVARCRLTRRGAPRITRELGVPNAGAQPRGCWCGEDCSTPRNTACRPRSSGCG